MSTPGLADITADVDFTSLKSNLEKGDKVITFGPVEQGKFLERLGAQTRLENLLENCNEEDKKALKSGFDMLVNPQKMGQRFKFLSVHSRILIDHLKKFPVNGF